MPITLPETIARRRCAALIPYARNARTHSGEAEESPHLSLGKVKGELYIGCAEHDKLAPLPMVQELRTLFSRAGTAGEIELYPGVHHGFAFPQRWCYDKPAAERHWERLIALYRRRLG